MARTSKQKKAQIQDSITVVATDLQATLKDIHGTERTALNNVELCTNTRNVYSLIQQERPKNTVIAYKPKKREFQQFCASKQYHDRDTVTEDKLLLFLVECVAQRPLRGKSYKTASETPRTATRLAWRSVRSYVTAITDLYCAQKALGMNSHPSPREHNVRDYIKALQRRDAVRDKANYADKGRDTLLDGYTELQLLRVCQELWAQTGESTECHFRTIVDILLSHYMLTRGGDRRALELSDLFTFEFVDEGPTRCMPLIMTTRAGKQNQHGRLETAGALRNRNLQLCLLGAIAFYLLFLWDLINEPFPDFSQRSAWYDIRLVKGNSNSSNRTKPFSYNAQREWVIKAFSYAGITSHKKTHIGRSSGAKTAELKGVSEDQIRRAGRWNQEQMVGCYLNALPREFMRSMAGHPKQMGCFEIRRAGLVPPTALLSMIWPELDQWEGRFGSGSGQINDLAAMGLTNLLFYLREVVLQDSALLMLKYPRSPVWLHPVFQHRAYLQYAQEVRAFTQEEERPSQLAVLTQAMPVLSDFPQSIDMRNEARLVQLDQKLEKRLGNQSQQGSQILSLLSNGLTVHIKATNTSPDGAMGVAITATAGPAGSPAAGPAGPLTAGPAGSPAAGLAGPPTAGPPPQYSMSRAVKTVEGLWKEWTVGLYGQPAVWELDSRWGHSWRGGRYRSAVLFTAA